MSNSQVLCRSLGFSNENNFNLVARNDVELYTPTNRSFTCRGSESGLQYCKQLESTPPLEESIVNVKCRGFKDESTVRLVGGLTVKEGRAEVFHRGEWGTICMKGMVLSDATALCRSAGFDTRTAKFNLSLDLPAGTGRIWIDNLRCDGSESHINECTVSWGSMNCSHADDIYMYCYSENDIRLSNILYGELQVYHSEVWGSVCISSYYYEDSNKTAEVACRSLGFTDPVVGQYKANIVTSKVWLNNINCNGGEKRIVDCDHDDWGNNYCFHVRTRFFVVCMQTVVPLTTEQIDLCRNKCFNGNCYSDTCHCYGGYYGRWCDYYEYEPYDPDNHGSVIAGVVIGSISGVVFLVVIIVLLIQRKKMRREPQTLSVAYSANQVNLIPVVQIAAPQALQASVSQPQCTLGAQASLPENEQKVPLGGGNEHLQNPPAYTG
ncbi:CD5 antigen-like [Anneissia japonica]|uniref:CD5 antigen-like n=1 Tax=Anneissia japonica TaxID=1529436 RepID=UPI00142588A1|nr:CD5 antigen-like [Anneissia japonica]